MLIYLHGDDTYRLAERLKFLKDGFKKKYDPAGLNMVTLEADKLTIGDFHKHLTAQGLLVKKRMIIIDNLASQAKEKKFQKELKEYLESQSLPEDNIIIFVEEEAVKERRKKTTTLSPLAAYFSKNGKPEHYQSLTGYDLNKWVDETIKKRGGKIDRRAAELLISLVGNDLWHLSAEIDKLIAFRNGKLIIAEDIQELVKAKFDTDIFKLTDALSQKSQNLALKLLHDQLSSGAHELYLLTMLIRQFKILLQVKEVAAQEKNYYTVASRLGIHPFVATKALTQVKNFSLAELKKIYQKLLGVDLKIKTSSQAPKTLLDLLIIEICRPSTRLR